MTPFEPSKPSRVGTDAGSGVKIIARDQHPLRPRAVGRDIDEGVDRLGRTRRVVLANPDHPSARRVHGTVGVAHPSRRARGFRYRDRRSSALQPVEPLVGVVAEIDAPAADQISATPIFVDSRTNVEGALTV
jgi:hypothetical protein